MATEVFITKWDPKVVKAWIADIIENRMDAAAKFVEDDARRRLLAIKKPDTKRDVNYRNYLAGWILTHQVENDGKKVSGLIGMKIGKEGQRHHGFYIETGSSTAPAQPYLRPALIQNAREIMRILTE